MAHEFKKNIEGLYKQRLSWRYDRVQFIGLPSLKDNRDLSLEEIYVPLGFTRKPGDKKERFYLPKALSESRHLVILGDPGCGKSTLVKLITHAFGRSTSSSLPQHFGPLLPIPIILRDYRVGEWKSYEDMLRSFIKQLDEEIRDSVTVEWLTSYLEKGQAIVLLDGIDEIGSAEARRHLRDQIIQPLIAQFPESYSILTSRIIGYEEVPFDQTAALPEYDNTKMSPVRHMAMVNLIKGQPSYLRTYVAPFNDEDIEQFITRWYTARESDAAQRSEGIESLKRALTQNDRVKRLASNPSLLTLIALIFRVTANLPSGRVKLYDKITEAYLETIEKFRGVGMHDATLEQKRRWLARVGWEMQSRRDYENQDDLLVSRKDVGMWLKEAIAEERENAAEEAKQFLDYITRRSGLLIPRGVDDAGNDLFSFVHLTFQEYFAALHLRSLAWDFNQIVKHCSSHLMHSYWHETILVLFEMLAEMRGSGDRLVKLLAEQAKEPKQRQAAAEIFSALLLDSESGLSPAAQELAAHFALEAVCAEINDSVIQYLKGLSQSNLDRWIAEPMKRQLREAEPNQWGCDFLLVGNGLIPEWRSLVKEIVITRSDAKWAKEQVAIATMAVSGSKEVIEWAVYHLPLPLWLAPIWWGYFARVVVIDGRNFVVGNISIAELNMTLIYKSKLLSPRHQLLVQAALALAASSSQILRRVVTERSLTPPLALYLKRSLVRCLSESFAQSLDRYFNWCLDQYLDGYLTRSLSRSLTPFSVETLAPYLSRNLVMAMKSTRLDSVTVSTGKPENALVTLSAAAEWLAFQPEQESERLATIEALRQFLPATKANDDWTRLLAINNLITLSAGTPELVAERNRLCDKAMKQPDQFTFPAELREATQDKEWFNLPEVIAIIFLHDFDSGGKSDPFLKPEWFDPASEESKFFLTPPREFFALAAEVLDPKGETEWAKWR
ncbi:MAG: NACHT domain-containing protein [Acidobacteriota bacterium]